MMIKVGEPVFLSNLLVYPLLGEDKGNGYCTLDEVQNRIIVEELPKARVEAILVENRADRPLLMIDGEEVIGALQNRIVATSAILEPMTRTEILTTCVEQNRWQGSRSFKTGETCSFPSIRAIIARASVKGESPQGKVWEHIDKKLKSTRTISKTSSMHDIYENLDSHLDRYVAGIEDLEANGMIGVCGDLIIGLDYFRSRELFKRFKVKLIRSYGLEAIDRNLRTGAIEVKPFIQKVFNSKKRWRKVRGGGQGQVEARMGRDYVARRLRYRHSLIHLSAFSID
ncbi:MAG TPA: hypothetical protein EYP24_01570 [bacterium (Candidatus Stahlbacteria)]|nr:hypothetical protein [Candidatus Stahlbacteria bacterium]